MYEIKRCSAKRCEVTINDMTKDQIMAILNNHSIIHKYAFILHDRDVNEDGTPSEPHNHVYLDFGNNVVNLNLPARWFNVTGNRVSRIKGKLADVLLYYTHKNFPDKHQYPIDDIVANFDVEAVLGAAVKSGEPPCE